MLTLTEKWLEFDLESPVIRFAMLWGLKPDDLGTNLMAVVETHYPYNAFVDESIQERYGVKATSVAAYVTTFDRWIAFEKEWRAILQTWKIPLDGKEGHDLPFMHMTDFIAGKRQFEHAPPRAKRDEFMERLTMTISEHVTLGVSVAVVDEQFERVLSAEARNAWREPYFFCLWGVLHSLVSMERRFAFTLEPSKPLWFLFDPRQKARQYAANLFFAVKQRNDSNALEQMGFGEMWRTPQIQAADVLAYEAARHVIEIANRPDIGMRKSLETLGRRKNLFMVEMNEQNLRDYVAFVAANTD